MREEDIKKQNLSKEFLDSIFKGFNEAVMLIDSKYKIQYCSPNIEPLLQLPNLYFINKNIDTIFYDKDFIKGNFLLHLNENDDVKFTTNLVCDIPLKNLNCVIRFQRFAIKNTKFKYIAFIANNTLNNIIKRDLIRKTVSIERLTKSQLVRNGNFEKSILEILNVAASAIRVDRVNAWEFDANQDAITCIGHYAKNEESIEKNKKLLREKFPNYFQLFKTDKIILTQNVDSDVKTIELLNLYLKPNNINAMMDIPIRIQGKMVGVLCFEHKKSTRVWQLPEQLFGLICAQLISQVIENKQKRELSLKIEESNKHTSILNNELKTRFDNNLNLLLYLLEYYKKSKTKYNTIDILTNKIINIKELNKLFTFSNKPEKIHILDFFNNIISIIENLFDDKKFKFKKQVDDIELSSYKAVPIGLLFYEIIYHTFSANNYHDSTIEFFFLQRGNRCNLIINNELKSNKTDKSFQDLLNAITKQLDASINISYDNGESYLVTFNN